MSTFLSQFDKHLFMNLVGLYFFDGVLDIDVLQKSLDETIVDIPVLSSVIVQRGNDYCCDHVSSNNVKIASKEVEDKYYEFYRLQSDNGIANISEGVELYSLLDHVETEIGNFAKPILNKPVMKITLLLTKEKKRSMICVSVNHCIVDAYSLTCFMCRWSSGVEEFQSMKFDLSRRFLRRSKDIQYLETISDPKMLEMTSAYRPVHTNFPKEQIGFQIVVGEGNAVTRGIHFTKERMEEMKKLVVQDLKKKNIKFSSHDCMSAHLWKLHVACMTKDFPNPDTVFPFFIVINFRNRVEGIGDDFFGNAVYCAVLEMKRSEILGGPFSNLVLRIRDLIESTNKDTIQCLVDYRVKYGEQNSFGRKLAWSMDDWRVLDVKRPGNFGLANVKYERMILAPPSSHIALTQIALVNMDSRMTGFRANVSFESKFYSKIKDFDLTSPETIPKICEILKIK